MGTMTEQEACEYLEELVGGPDKAFRLMNIYRHCEMHAEAKKMGTVWKSEAERKLLPMLFVKMQAEKVIPRRQSTIN